MQTGMIARLIFGKKRRDRWWRYQVFSKAYRVSQSCVRGGEGECRPLREAFHKLGYGSLSDELAVFWVSLVDLGAERQPELSRDCLTLSECKASGLDPKQANTLCWLDLSRLCVGIGFFQLARILREKALKRAVFDSEDPEASLAEVTRACYVHCELGEFDDAKQQLSRMYELGQPSSRVEQASWFIDLLKGSYNSEDLQGPAFGSASEEEYGQFIKGRKMAVVGPAPSELAQGGDIDSRDVVVKFNYRGGDKSRNPITQGQRIDVSYYNNDQAKVLSEGLYSGVFSEVEWAVFVNNKGRRCFPLKYTKLRTVASLQWMLPDTHFNAGPNVIIDLLRFSPGSICIYNTDLMLSAGRFAGYQPEGDKPINYTRSFIKTHDPILQYQIMHRLWSAGYVTGDERFESVMGMGLKEYLCQLQKAYGAVTRALY